jgi:hypothetical protein
MTDLRESIGWIIGSVIAGIGAFLSWFYESGLLGAVVGVIIGVLVTDFVQKRTQKRIWKRDYSIKIAEQIYGQLYGSIKSIIRTLEREEYSNVSFGFWDSAQEDHRYFMVDEKFRNRLDAFLERTQEYTSAVNRLENTILPKIIKDTARDVFHEEPHPANAVNFSINYTKGKVNSGYSPNLVNHLKRKQDLSDMIYCTIGIGAEKTEISNVRIKISFLKFDPSSQFESTDSDRIAIFWGLCLETMDNIPEYQFVVKENNPLLEEAKGIKKELIKRIEEPWRI